MPTVDLPWDREASFTRLLMCDQGNKPSFHRPDIWHNAQLGIAKAFAANSLVSMMDFFNGTSVETRLEAMTKDFLQYCRDSRH